MPLPVWELSTYNRPSGHLTGRGNKKNVRNAVAALRTFEERSVTPSRSVNVQFHALLFGRLLSELVDLSIFGVLGDIGKRIAREGELQRLIEGYRAGARTIDGRCGLICSILHRSGTFFVSPTPFRLLYDVLARLHVQELAADISAVGQDRLQNKRLVELLDERNLPFDQCILYDHLPAIGPRWIHLNVRLDPTQNRRVYLRR